MRTRKGNAGQKHQAGEESNNKSTTPGHGTQYDSSFERAAVLGVVEAMDVTRPELVFENEKISVFQQQLGEWDNLNHLIVCRVTNNACIVDPFDGKYWYEFCQSENYSLAEIWLTHSHWDHTKGVEEILQISLGQVKVRCHSLEQERGYQMDDVIWWHHEEFSSINQQIGDLSFSIHCTPGHTPGHVTIIGNGVVITGDCLFLGRCGRTDLFGGDRNKQRKSLQYLRDFLLQLDTSYVVLPGHQYELSDGSNPTVLNLSEFMSNNEALNSIDNDSEWNSLPFLSFDDSLAEKARRQRASNS